MFTRRNGDCFFIAVSLSEEMLSPSRRQTDALELRGAVVDAVTGDMGKEKVSEFDITG